MTWALVLVSAGLTLVAVGAWLPWLTVFNGLTVLRGFDLDGGYLAGMAVAVVAMLAVARRRGGSLFLRPTALIVSALVLADSLYSGWRIAGYVGNPGATAALVRPVAGVGPLIMAAGGLALLLAAALSPISRRRLDAGHGLPLALATALFAAGWIHLVLTPEHMSESTLLGIGFLASGLAQIALAALVLRHAGDAVLSASLIVNVALIALYAWAVLVGSPLAGGIGSDHAAGLAVGAGEAIDPTGAAAKLAELTALPLAVVLMRRNAKAD